MHFAVVTLFPEAFGSFLRTGLLCRAIESELLAVTFRNPRDFTTDKHRSVDDAPYGGGSGMVMMPGPLLSAMESIDADVGAKSHRVLLTPQGQPFTQATAQRFSSLQHLTLVCGRYEGVDERAREAVDEEVSLGDFVLLGGEVGAMAVIESVGRLLPGVLGNAQSSVDESHVKGRLEYPQYTRPAEFRGQKVPDVLLSGNHARIDRWRKRESLIRTRERRADLFEALSAEERASLNDAKEEKSPK